MITSHWHDYSKAHANAFEKYKKINEHSMEIDPDDVKIHSIDFLAALNNLIVLDLKVVQAGDKYICKIDGHGFRDFQYNQGFREIAFKYSDSYECFNTDS